MVRPDQNQSAARVANAICGANSLFRKILPASPFDRRFYVVEGRYPEGNYNRIKILRNARKKLQLPLSNASQSRQGECGDSRLRLSAVRSAATEAGTLHRPPWQRDPPRDRS